jgi:hypothetical protein
MSIKEKSLKLAAVSLIADEAKKAKDRLRAELQEEMDELGADRVKAELGDETVAYITTTKPKFKWEITSDIKFLHWVKEYFPSEIIETVRESSIDKLLEKLQLIDEMVIDHNGEEIRWAVPNIADPYLTTKFAGDGREKLRSAIVGNAIDARKVLELE